MSPAPPFLTSDETAAAHGLSRRALVLAAPAAILARNAGAQPAAPGAGLAPPAPAQIHLRAEAVMQHLAGPAHTASSMLRLVRQIQESGGQTSRSGQPGSGVFPVLRVRQDEPLAIEIENGLDHLIAFHLHGLRGANADDTMPGLTGASVAPGARIVIPVNTRRPGAFILMPVLAARAPEHNARGLHAAVIVEALAQPAGDHDLVLALSDWRLDEHGRLAGGFGDVADAARIGRLGNRLAVNGMPAPGTAEISPGARLRVHLLNVSNARTLPLGFKGLDARVIAVDSTPCEPFDPMRRPVLLAPGSRIELLLEAPPAPGMTGMIEARLGNGIPIHTFRTRDQPAAARKDKPLLKRPALPDAGIPPGGHPPDVRLEQVVRADIRITGGVGQKPAESLPEALRDRFPDATRIFAVNGSTAGFSGPPVLKVPRGRGVVFTLRNDTEWPQVLTLHGHCFRLLYAFDDGWEPFFLDTVHLPAGRVARIAFVADNPGRWAVRSTVAEHYAAGVRAWFEVV